MLAVVWSLFYTNFETKDDTQNTEILNSSFPQSPLPQNGMAEEDHIVVPSLKCHTNDKMTST